MFSPLYIIILVLGIITFSLIIYTYMLSQRLKSLFRGQNGKSLENIIHDTNKKLDQLNTLTSENSKGIIHLSNKLRSRVRNISTIRFKPFEDAGSNQSFAIAIVDDESNGVILSSLYTRERMSVFAKPVKNGKSEFELTNEEKSVLESAKNDTI